MKDLRDHPAFHDARHRVHELKHFYHNLTSFVIINVFLFVVNYFTYSGHWWFVWPLAGWGMGIIIHALSIYGILFTKKWEHKKIKKYLDRHDQEN